MVSLEPWSISLASISKCTSSTRCRAKTAHKTAQENWQSRKSSRKSPAFTFEGRDSWCTTSLAGVGQRGKDDTPRSKMEQGKNNDVFLSSDVDLDVRLKVRAALPSPCSRNSQPEGRLSLTRSSPPHFQLRRSLSSTAAYLWCVCNLTTNTR